MAAKDPGLVRVRASIRAAGGVAPGAGTAPGTVRAVSRP